MLYYIVYNCSSIVHTSIESTVKRPISRRHKNRLASTCTVTVPIKLHTAVYYIHWYIACCVVQSTKTEKYSCFDALGSFSTKNQLLELISSIKSWQLATPGDRFNKHSAACSNNTVSYWLNQIICTSTWILVVDGYILIKNNKKVFIPLSINKTDK